MFGPHQLERTGMSSHDPLESRKQDVFMPLKVRVERRGQLLEDPDHGALPGCREFARHDQHRLQRLSLRAQFSLIVMDDLDPGHGSE